MYVYCQLVTSWLYGLKTICDTKLTCPTGFCYVLPNQLFVEKNQQIIEYGNMYEHTEVILRQTTGSDITYHNQN